MLYFTSIFLGGLFTLCFAPYYVFVAGFAAITGLMVLLDFARSNRRRFILGFLFGFIHHVTGLYWISNSLLVEADKFAWLIPFAASLIPAILALFIGFVCYLTHKLEYKGFAKILFFSSAWVFAEIIRGHALTGFPWNLTGYIFMGSIEISQAAAYVGVYGLSLLAIILFSAPYMVFSSLVDFKFYNRVTKISFSMLYLLPIVFVTAIISMNGREKILKNTDKFEKTYIRVVQPNISQQEKMDNLRLGEQLYKLYTLSVKKSEIDGFVPDLIIWPEAATPFNIKVSPLFRDEVSDIVPYSAYLLLGSIRYDIENNAVYNSMEIIDGEGNLVEDKFYNKHHLVPFGEYIPLRKIFPLVESIAGGHGDFSRGKGPDIIKLDNAPAFSPNICYEIIFPNQVVDNKPEFKDRAKFILNLTNDAWFGDSTGPYQHLDKSRMRAIEEGVPVIRAANTGVSAVIDANGIILKSLELNKKGVIDIKLPAALERPTYFSEHGNKTILLICSFMMVFSIILKAIRRWRKK